MDTTQINLDQFTGTEHYYKHWLGLTYTDGMAYVAETMGAYWLIDLVASHQPKLRGEGFQVWTLSKEKERKYIALCDDGNGNELKRQIIPFTTFPEELMPFKMYLVNKVLMLPSEY